MANYVVTYDLEKVRDYQKVYKAMDSVSAVRLLGSVWLMTSHRDAGELLDWMRGVTDSDDNIAIVKLGSDWATYGVPTEASDWLASHL